jgi:hypothetical protein
MTYDSKDIITILRNAHCADSIRKLVQKLGRLASRVDLPDVWFVDQRHKDLAVGSNRDILNPLWWSAGASQLLIVRRTFSTTHSLVRKTMHRLHKSICIANMHWGSNAKAGEDGNQAN